MNRYWSPIGCSAAAIVFAAIALAPGQAGAQTKVTDKWITVVMPAEPPNFDGCESGRAPQGRIVKHNVTETLIEMNPKDGSLSPRLALSWEQTDPNTWRIKLRKGVTFHDGSPFNAATAKKSIERTLNTKIVCNDRTKFFGGIKVEIETPDDETLLIRTATPEPTMPPRLANTSIVGPNTDFDKLALNAIGTGPYIFDSWQAGQQVLLKRNENYWGPKPAVEGVRYVWRSEPSIAAAMVAVGEADIALNIAAQDAVDPKLDRAYQNPETTFLRIDSSRAPFDDRRVRLAMNYALDLDEIRGRLLPKEVVRATQIVVPSIPGHNHEIDKKTYPYDPAKAKQLLAEAKAAGVPVDKEITFLASTYHYPNSVEVAEAFRAMYEAVGLNIKVQTLEPGQYTKWSNKPHPEDRGPTVLQAAHDNMYGDPVFSVYLRYACDGNSSAFCDPQFDKELARVSGLSGQERVKGWEEIFRYLHEDAVPYVMMFHMVGHVRISPRLDFTPDVSTYAELRVEKIGFK